MAAPPAVQGFTHVSLSVRDLDASLRFYRDVIGLPVLAEPYSGKAFVGREAIVLAGRSALCLQCHDANPGTGFDPRRTGLDHVALAVASRDDLDSFAAHLDGVGVAHSGVRPLPGFGHVLEVRDPDDILVEIHALAARDRQ